jgi:hypothetical protein
LFDRKDTKRERRSAGSKKTDGSSRNVKDEQQYGPSPTPPPEPVNHPNSAGLGVHSGAGIILVQPL